MPVCRDRCGVLCGVCVATTLFFCVCTRTHAYTCTLHTTTNTTPTYTTHNTPAYTHSHNTYTHYHNTYTLPQHTHYTQNTHTTHTREMRHTHKYKAKKMKTKQIPQEKNHSLSNSEKNLQISPNLLSPSSRERRRLSST